MEKTGHAQALHSSFGRRLEQWLMASLAVLALLLISTPSVVRQAAADAMPSPPPTTSSHGASSNAGRDAGARPTLQAPQPKSVGAHRAKEKAYADNVYIVAMNDRPPWLDFTASGQGSGSTTMGLRRSGSRNNQRVDTSSVRARTYSASLASAHMRTLASAGVRSSARLGSMTYALNAFGAVLTPQEAARVRSQPGVASVERSRIYFANTLYTPDYLRLESSLWSMATGQESAGEDVIIGVVDTGIWPEHPSFTDKTPKPYGPPPAKWRGTCTPAPDFPVSLCNRKLIGANVFLSGFTQQFRGISNSPRDDNGHGTWCASAAGGNPVRMTNGGEFVGLGSGMAPRARISSYKVCGANGACMDLDILLALEKGMMDGVDVITMSLGGRGPDDFFGQHEQMMLLLALNGVAVVVSAGNAGETAQFNPSPQTAHNAPWYMTVAASTIPTPQMRVSLGSNGRTISGLGWVSGNANTRRRRLLMAADCAVDPKARLDEAKNCYIGSLSAARCSGAIIVCRGGSIRPVIQSQAVVQAGGVGILILGRDLSASQSLVETYAVPGCLFPLAESKILEEYMTTVDSPTATIEDVPAAPAMASFSSRGPVVDPARTTFPSSGPSPHILKPDITAPGVNLLSAFGLSGTPYAVMSGTSMATPHVAGLAAMLKQLRPMWSSARIKSAIMTTATVRDNTGGPIKMETTMSPATPFSFGSGHVNPSAMANPGLVYDAGKEDYYNFLAGINVGRAHELQGVTFTSRPIPVAGYNLNQPYICVAQLKGSVVVTRRVTNVASTALVFNSILEQPSGVNVEVIPAQLPALGPGASTTFLVRLTVVTPSQDFRFGSLMWASTTGGFEVRSPIVVQPVSP